jgi:conjugative transfer region protein TrbK
MRLYLTARQFAGIVATGFIVLDATLAVTRSQRGDDAGINAAPEHEDADALASEVARCRTVTSDQTAALEICRRIWAENRRQFFRPTRTPPVPAGPIPSAATATGKNRDRVSPVEAEHQPREVR